MEGYIKKEKVKIKKKEKSLIEKSLIGQIEKKLLFTLVAFLVSLVSVNNEALVCIIPILALGYLLDFSYLVCAITSTILSSLFLGSNYFLLYAIMLFSFCFFAFISQLLPLKLYTRIGVSVFVSDAIARTIFLVGNKLEPNIMVLVYSLISIFLFCIGLKINHLFLHKKIDKINNFTAISIGIYFFLTLFGLNNIINNLIVLSALFHLMLLIFTRIYGISILSFLGLCISVLLYYLWGSNFNDIILFVMPSLFAFLLGKNGKYQALFAYVLAYLGCAIIQNKEILSLDIIFIPVSVVIVYSCIPNLVFIETRKHFINEESIEKENLIHVKKLENDIIKKLEKFSSLFETVSLEYQEEENYKLMRKQTTYVFQNLCMNCPKNKQCFQNSNIDNIPLFLKSITSEINDEDIQKINENCLKPSRFIELSSILKNEFYLEYQYDQHYRNLKKALAYQMNGFKELIDKYSNKIKVEKLPSINQKEETIKNALHSLNLDILYVKTSNLIDGKLEIILDIKLNKVEDLYSLLIPSLENTLHASLKIKDIKEVILENYYSLIIVEQEEYEFILGVHQRSKENSVIGDSYINFSDSFNQIYAISDGMGVGEEAREESKTTIKLLKQVLECEMDIKSTILMINSLLKIKNRFDTYATLDIVNIDKKTLKANFSKNGSPFSYVYRPSKEELIKVDPSSLPIGIVDDIEVYDCCINLQEDDYIVMFSDGISGSERKMKEIFKRCINYHPQILAKEILDSYVGKKIKDDTTVMVIKIKRK